MVRMQIAAALCVLTWLVVEVVVVEEMLKMASCCRSYDSIG